MKCPDQNTIFRLIDRDLDASELQETVEHVKNCSDCLEEFERASGLENRIRSDFSELLDSSGLSNKVMEKVRGSQIIKQPAGAVPSLLRLPLKWFFAGLTIFVLLLFALPYVSNTGPEHFPNSETVFMSVSRASRVDDRLLAENQKVFIADGELMRISGDFVFNVAEKKDRFEFSGSAEILGTSGEFPDFASVAGEFRLLSENLIKLRINSSEVILSSSKKHFSAGSAQHETVAKYIHDFADNAEEFYSILNELLEFYLTLNLIELEDIEVLNNGYERTPTVRVQEPADPSVKTPAASNIDAPAKGVNPFSEEVIRINGND